MELESKIFEKLYKYDKNNNIKEWAIWVINRGKISTINITYGVVNSKKVECVSEISKGKNIGKKNETTHFQQAILEAESKWKNKQTNDGYIIGLNFTQSKIIKPMLAHIYSDYENKLSFPCFAQPKYDGYRMIFDGEKCLTRQGKEYEILNNTILYQELKVLYEEYELILDGELYSEKLDFESLGILRKKTLKNEDDFNKLNTIYYYVYDIINTTLEYEDRLKLLQKIFLKKFKKLKIVPTIEIQTKDDIKNIHLEFRKNFEGTIFRNKKGLYEKDGRSFNLLKYKDINDAEYEITGFSYEINKINQKKLILWECKTTNGTSFKVRPKGTVEERNEIYNNCLKNFIYKGKLLWVEFLELTNKKVPRFPTTKSSSIDSYIREIL